MSGLTEAMDNDASPGASSPAKPRNFAELYELAKTWTDYAPSYLSVMMSHIRTVGLAGVTACSHRHKNLGVQPRKGTDLSTVPCDVAWLNDHIFSVTAAAMGQKSERSLAAAISGTRVALRRVGILNADLPKVPLKEGHWRFLLEALSSRGSLYGHGLAHYAAYCHQHQILPEAADDATLAAYKDYLCAHTLRRGIDAHVRNTAKAWRMAARLIESWPEQTVKAPSRRVRSILPLTAYPETFQRDVAAHVARLSGKNRRGPFSGDGPSRPLRQKTIDSHVFSIRQAAWAYTSAGYDRESLVDLSILVQEAVFREIGIIYWNRAIAAAVGRGEYASVDVAPYEAGVTSMTGRIASTLLSIARHHCKLPEAQCKVLAKLTANLKPPRATNISSTNLARVRQFDDPKLKLDLLRLPSRLMQMAESEDLSPRRRAIKARTAVAIELELHAPVRLSNLVSLEFGTHLRHDGSRSGRITRLMLSAHETKNRHTYEQPIDADLSCLIETYRVRYHPILAPAGSKFLFPAGDRKSGHLAACTMAEQIKSTIEREAGAYANPHLFRHLAVRFILQEDPDAKEDARQLLGDRDQGVVDAHYASLEPEAAARRHHDRIKRARKPVLPSKLKKKATK